MRYRAELPGDWRHPHDDPPPKGENILMLTQYGRLIIGLWYDKAAVWMPLPKLRPAMKERLWQEDRLR